MLDRTTIVTSPASDPVANPLTAFGEDRAPAGLLTVPDSVGLPEELQLDELGRRPRWLPADRLL